MHLVAFEIMGSITNFLLLIFFIPFMIHSSHPKKALVHSISSNSMCIESERKALLEIKASLGSESSKLSSWTGSDCCSWDGITCYNLTGHVQSLDIDNYLNFNSPLSPWLFNLTHLEVLKMRGSGLIGHIPNMLDKLTSLTYLDLSANDFDPATFPNSLCSLTSLTCLDLSFSQLQGSLPSCLANFTSLIVLHLGFNKLSGEIPGFLGHLTNLTSLDLSENRFNSSIPSTFGHLQQLRYLDLSHNELSGAIPSTLGSLPQLQYLDISQNSLMGELSESFLDGLKSLQELKISENHHMVFNVSPQWIPPFQLSLLYMMYIFVGTPFPPWLQTQTHLTHLALSNTSISGAIPDWCLTAFSDLYELDLSNNFLTGSVPPFDNATHFYLQLSGNQLSGKIPQQLCNITYLEFLSLGNNQLTGGIPLCLGLISPLGLLDLGNNLLSGSIPNELGSLNNLDTLHLNGNMFSGEIPSSLQNLTALTTLDLGENELQGSIPPWLGENRLFLQYLRLESNNFLGDIPVNLCQLLNLHILNLAHNHLVGTIPTCLGNLVRMSLDDTVGIPEHLFNPQELLNIIKGRAMTYTSSLPYAKFMSLSSNHLHGEIPIELMNLTGLQSLNLSNNELTGRIPETINNLKGLESLDLSMNHLSGKIPQTLTSIDALSYLNLSFNNLAGKVPSGNHFDTLDDPSIYEGNEELCGKLLMKICPDDGSPNGHASEADHVAGDQEVELLWMCGGIGPGFAFGFLGVICSLIFKDLWRIAYFGFVDSMYDKLRASFAIRIAQLRSKFN